jgi:hypothetical protein
MALISLIVTPPGIQASISPASLPNSNGPSLGYLPDNNDSFETGIVTDQLANLIEISFDGTPFPAISFAEHGAQSLAIHEYPNLDSARIENTGRKPMTWALRGIFTNNIYPSINETWTSGNLYPDTFEAVRSSLEDTTAPIKILVHPNDGPVNVCVQSWSFEYLGTGPRDGVYMDMVFIETLAGSQIAATISTPNPVAQLTNTASNLDDLIGNSDFPVQPPGMNLSGFFSSLSDTISNAIANPTLVVASLNQPIFTANISFNQTISSGQYYQTSATNYTNANINVVNILGVNSGLSVSNMPMYSASALAAVYSSAFSLNSAQQNNATQLINSTLGFLNNLVIFYTSINNISTAQIKLNLYLMIDQLQQIQQTLFKNSNQYQVQTYTVLVPTTLMSLSNILNNTVNQLLSLNPTLNKTLLIPASIAVNYFQG